MIKLGCNAMLPLAADLPYPDKEDSRNWMDIAELVRRIRAWDLDSVDFQLFRGFRSRDPAYLRSIKMLCQRCGLPIGFWGVGGGFLGTRQVDGQTLGAPLSGTELRRRITQVKEGVDTAAFMGAPLIRLFGGGIPSQSPGRATLWKSVIDSFREVCDYAAGKNGSITNASWESSVEPNSTAICPSSSKAGTTG